MREEAQATYSRFQREQETFSAKKASLLESYHERLRLRIYTLESTLAELQALSKRQEDMKKPDPGMIGDHTKQLRGVSEESSHLFRQETFSFRSHSSPLFRLPSCGR